MAKRLALLCVQVGNLHGSWLSSYYSTIGGGCLLLALGTSFTPVAVSSEAATTHTVHLAKMPCSTLLMSQTQRNVPPLSLSLCTAS